MNTDMCLPCHIDASKYSLESCIEMVSNTVQATSLQSMDTQETAKEIGLYKNISTQKYAHACDKHKEAQCGYDFKYDDEIERYTDPDEQNSVKPGITQIPAAKSQLSLHYFELTIIVPR